MQGPILNPNSGKVGNFDVYLETMQGMYRLSVGQKTSYSMAVYFSSDFFISNRLHPDSEHDKKETM